MGRMELLWTVTVHFIKIDFFFFFKLLVAELYMKEEAKSGVVWSGWSDNSFLLE